MNETIVTQIHDPFRRCEEVCTHDLARGLLVSELLGGEGPYPDSHPLMLFRSLPRRNAPPAATVAEAS